MKTRIEEMESRKYIPNVGEAFIFENASVALFRIDDDQGVRALSHSHASGKIYAVSLLNGAIVYLQIADTTFIPLEPLGGEIVFRLKR